MPTTIIPNNNEILNYINSLNLDFSGPQVNHLKNLVTGIISIDSKRNISNLSNKVLGGKDRSCVTKFLNNSPWDEDSLRINRLNNLLDLVKPKASEPIFIAIADTVIAKSKDTKHIEALGYHFSHIEGKSVWGHCIVSSQLITKTHSIPYRCIYPKGIEIKISDFIKYTTESDFKDINIKDKTYKVYRYEGKASGIDNAVVLICYEANKENPKIVSILSTDTGFSSKRILKYYSSRWEIETSFLYLKDRLGLKHYQMRKIKDFTRFWIIVYLAYTLLERYRARASQEKSKLTLGDAIRLFKGDTFKSLITWTYLLATLNISLFEFYKVFGLAP